ncbi:MAG: putative porin [Candidatus Omnitrophota bacterium]
MKRLKSIVAVMFIICFFNKTIAYAGEMDILVEKLVEKGILTRQDAQEVLDETRKEIAEEEQKQKKSSQTPEWVEKIKVKGDFRTRYQWEDRETNETRGRARIRFRLGSEIQVTENVKVGAGLATGGADPRSTNETLDNTFETPDIRLDYAYGQYQPVSEMILKAGKIHKMPFWHPSDFIWDSDINPDGVSLGFNSEVYSKTDIYFNTACFVLDESSTDTSDPFMYVIQPGIDTCFFDKFMDFKMALTYYGFYNAAGTTLSYSSGTNTLSNGVLKYNYDSLGVSSEIGFNNIFDSDIVPYIAVIWDYICNFDPANNKNGFLIGCKIGDEKVKKQKQWQAGYNYRRLERDAFPDTFPDSDCYSGGTDVKAHEIVFNYGLLDNVILGIDYYYSEPVSRDPDQKEHLLQTDILLKF